MAESKEGRRQIVYHAGYAGCIPGKSDYAKYDASVCEWNRFVKDFFRDKRNTGFRYPLRMAAALWQAVKESDLPKIYSSDLRESYKMLLAKKEKSFSNFKTSKESKGHE